MNLIKTIETIKIQQNITIQETFENVKSVDESGELSGWFSTFLMDHPSFCDFFAQTWVLNTCKIGLFCSCLCLFYQTINILPYILIPNQIEKDIFSSSSSKDIIKNTTSDGTVYDAWDRYTFVLTD